MCTGTEHGKVGKYHVKVKKLATRHESDGTKYKEKCSEAVAGQGWGNTFQMACYCTNIVD